MTLVELQKKLRTLKNKGFIPSLRQGPTGIGYTLERELGITESNIPIPDIGGRVELKATRRKTMSLITLFTFNKGVWQIPQKELIKKYGYTDDHGRWALYCMVSTIKPNSQGLLLILDEDNHSLNLIHSQNREPIASWDIYHLVSKLLSKTEKLLFVVAEVREGTKPEEFHFQEAYLLEQPSPEGFIKAINDGKIVIDVRMHLKKSQTVRNHGTGIRVKDSDLPVLFKKKKQII